MPVFVFVSNLFVCVHCIFVQMFLAAHSVPFCHCVSAIFSLCPRFLSQIRSLCVHSAYIVRAHSRVCVYSRRCLRPLCFYPLCVLLVFLSILFHTKTYEPFISGMYGMWMHILIHAFCKIFNWTIYQLCRCILQFTRLELHIQFEPLDLHIIVDQLLWEKWTLTYQKRAWPKPLRAMAVGDLGFLKPLKGL